MDIIKVIVLGLLFTSMSCLIHPSPRYFKLSEGSLPLEDVCDIFHQSSDNDLIQSQYYFTKITKRLNQNLQCPRPLVYNSQFHTLLSASKITTMTDEAYQLEINQEGIHINYITYSGYVYAMETLYQLLKKGLKEKQLPFVKIEDQPKFQHRGIMIDSARHFLKVDTIQKLIQNMPLSKLNILHWHMMDDESFPVKLDLHPELAQAGSFSSSKIYTTDDIKSLISLASKNGVKIIPEIQSPSHMRSWVLSPAWKSKNLTISCTSLTQTGKYSQQLDPTKSDSAVLVQQVLTELDSLFARSPYIHLGGDKIEYFCWDQRKEIATYMKLHNIKNYDALLNTWRYNLKQILPSSRKIIYWADQSHNYTLSPNDILQFKGNSSDLLSYMSKTSNQFILSPFNLMDLGTGFGNLWLNSSNFKYNTWRSIYEEYGKLISQLDTSRILGAELLLWGIFTNDETFQNNVWMRAAVFGERMWSTKTLPTAEIVQGIVDIQRTLEEAGIDVSPITSEYCEYKPQICWPQNPPTSEEINIYVE